MFLLETKLYELIRSFSAIEQEQITEFIHSPLFYDGQGRDKLSEFYTILRGEVERLEQGEQEGLSEKEIYQILFPGKSQNKTTLDSMTSRLTTIIRKFIIYKKADIDSFSSGQNLNISTDALISQYIALAKFYSEKNLSYHFDNTIKKLESLHKTPPLSTDHFLTRFLTHKSNFDYRTTFQHAEWLPIFNTVSKSLDEFYVFEKLHLLIHSTQLTPEFIENTFKNISPITANFSETGQKVLNIYQLIFSILISEKPEDQDLLYSFMGLMNRNPDILPLSKTKDLYACARNYCIKMYKLGHLSFNKLILNIYKDNLAAGLLYRSWGELPNGILFRSVQSIVNTALKENETEWALKFLEEHRNLIIAFSPQEQERFYHYNLARCYFQQKKYSEAFELLQLGFVDDKYNLAARSLEIKLYIEKTDKKDRENEYLEDRLSAFSVCLTGPKINPVDRNSFRHFIRLTRKYLKKKYLSEKDFPENASIAELDWLRSKIKN